MTPKRPAHRPRLNPKELRVLRTMRCRPITWIKLLVKAKEKGISASVLLDQLVASLK